MSVIVKGMEMPDNCEECQLMVDRWCYGVKNQPGTIYFHARPDWCPLRPLPEKHGDLVDIGQEVNIEYFDDMNQEWSWKAGTVADALVVCEEFPTTIVEAEGDDA